MLYYLTPILQQQLGDQGTAAERIQQALTQSEWGLRFLAMLSLTHTTLDEAEGGKEKGGMAAQLRHAVRSMTFEDTAPKVVHTAADR